jgi:hypothetical protein
MRARALAHQLHVALVLCCSAFSFSTASTVPTTREMTPPRPLVGAEHGARWWGRRLKPEPQKTIPFTMRRRPDTELARAVCNRSSGPGVCLASPMPQPKAAARSGRQYFKRGMLRHVILPIFAVS